MIKLWVIVLLSITKLAAEAVPVCMAVSESDARTILGPLAKRTNDPSGCQWRVTGSRKEMNVVRVGVASMFESARAGEAKKGVTKEESGLGGPAFSAIPSSHHGARAAIYLLKGAAVLIVDIDGFEKDGAEVHLPQVRDLVRKLAGKV